MALGTLPAAKLLYGDFSVFHVLPKLFISAKVVLQTVVNLFIVPAASQVNLGFVMAFDAPSHREGWLGQLDKARVFIHQLIDVVNFGNATNGVCLNITVAVLAL